MKLSDDERGRRAVALQLRRLASRIAHDPTVRVVSLNGARPVEWDGSQVGTQPYRTAIPGRLEMWTMELEHQRFLRKAGKP